MIIKCQKEALKGPLWRRESCIAKLNQRDMAKQLLTLLRLIACMNFSLKNYSCELLNLTRTVGKVELISTFTTAVCDNLG